ncbi:hypothetical protein Angca_008071 [Angiostrongylus cantonensis]|nr:hypothetical protein Angca_008071 [Angiostrongylus cantonensis]
MRMGDVWDRIRAKVLRTFGDHGLLCEEHSVSGDGQTSVNGGSSTSRSLNSDYTELMGGSVPCPSCKGTGRIPKEMEETLVALIPLNDDRLKPKRTWFWVLIGISICFLIASGVIFMLVPRAVDLHSNKPAINIIHVTEHTILPPRIRFHFMNYLNISNANYYIVQVVNTSATIIHANYVSRLEIYHTMEHERVFDKLAQWLLELVQHRHALWQMGEPASSAASKNFLSFAYPVLRIFAAYFKICGSLVGQVIKALPIRRSSDPKHSIKGLARVNLHTVELGSLSDVLLDAIFLMWSCTGGMNGQKFSTECRKIRLAVLDVLRPSLYCERSLSVIIRHTLLRGCSRPHLFPAALGYLLNLVPYPPPLVIPKADESSWKEVVVGYRQRMNKFVNAFSACENRSDIAEVLLAPSPYISEMARAFIDRMSRVDLRMAQELVELLLKYIVTLFESRLSNKYNDNAVTPAGSVTGEEMTKDNEKTRPASTGMVRLMESFIQLCQVHHFRTVLYYFLSRYPSRHRYLLSILSQFEKPTFESERQSRYQTAVLELLSGLCSPSLWSSEFTTFENDECVTSESIEACVFNGVDSPEPLTTVNVQENKNNVDEPMEVIGDELENDDTAVGLELVEETDCDSQPSSSLEATILSLCRFVNNADQKISAVQYALEIMMNATSDALKENNASFLKVLSGCLRRVGLHPFFERMNKSFNSGEVIACLQAATSILDNLYGEQPNLLLEVLDFSPSEHLFPSLISQINDKPNIDANANCVLKIMDRFCKSFKNHPATNGASQEEVEVPLMYGKSVAVAKLYSDPVVTVVTGRSESYKRIKAASSIPIKRRETNKTRMGSEVAKIIEAYRGKEKSFQKLLETQLKMHDAVPSRAKEAKSTGIEREKSAKVKEA